ncbi:hypothetical protein niasHT_009761 [Heterodera trifolii]|uniref:Uncharacterized protein n=1 Tax=Heterodera trifolii TaxID=157864 RepID=A0ABD2MDU0_9BILA
MVLFPTFLLLLPLFALLLSECRGIELVLRKDSSLDKLNISLLHASLVTTIGKKILVKFSEESFRPIFAFAGTSLDRPYLYVDESDKIKSINYEAIENAVKNDLVMQKKSATIKHEIEDTTYSIQKVDLGQIKSPSSILQFIGITTVFEYCQTRTGLPNEYFVISEIGDGDDDQVKMDCLQIFNKSAKSKDPPKNRKLVIKQLVNLPKMEIQWAKNNKFCKTVEQGIP